MNLVWVDLEMSGLNVQENKILEIAVVITDNKLNILAEGPSLVIFQTDSHMAAMDSWCTENHAATGLTAEVRNSVITEEVAEQKVIEFLTQWVNKGESPICGNSIGTDREFIKLYMPELHSWFHYRNFDVSTLKMANEWWQINDLKYEKNHKNQHRAKNDILESIAEANYYKAVFYGGD